MPRTLEEEILNLCAMRGRVEIENGIVRVSDIQGRPGFHVTFSVPTGERLIPRSTSGLYTAVIQRLDLAAQKLRYPSFRLVDSDGRLYRVYRSGAQSKFPGAASIEQQDARPGADAKWCGRIFRDGRLQFASGLPNPVRQQLQAILFEFCDSPLTSAKYYARATNACMFCAHPLEEPSSVLCGYGPVCAETYGLPHGQNGTAPRADISDIEQEVSDLFSKQGE